MNKQQAQSHNQKIHEQIKKLQDEFVTRLRIQVVERHEGGRREIVEDITTDYVRRAQYNTLYKDYRASYPNDKTHFILIEPLEDIKRKVRVVLPTRSDSEREPPTGMQAPDIDPFAQV